MRLTLIVSSTYKKSSQLSGLPSAGLDAELMEERFSEPDARAVVEQLAAGPKLESQLEQVLAKHCREPEQSAVVFYFSGHVMLREGGELALLLDSRRGGSLDLSRVGELLRSAAEDVLAVLDIVHAPDEEDLMASATVVAAVRDALSPKKTGIGVLVGARPSDSATPSGPSLFTRLFLLALEHLTPTRARSGAVRAGAVYEAMRDEEERFMEIPAAGHFRGSGDFALLEMPSIVIAADASDSVEVSAPTAPRVPRIEQRSSHPPPAAGRPPASSRPRPAAGTPPQSSRPGSSPAVTLRTGQAPAKATPPPKPPPSSKPAASRPPPKGQSTDELLDEGDAAAADGRHDEAIACWKRALLGLTTRRSARHAELYVRIGRAKRALGSDSEAVHNFDKALGVDPLDREAFSAAEELLGEQKDWSRLDRLHRRRAEALRSDEERSQVHRALALMWLRDAKEPRHAIKPLESWLELRPGEIDALEQLVEAEVALGRHAAAVAARRKLADALDGDSSRRARVLIEAAREAEEHLPDKQQAVELCEQALEADSSALEALEIAAPLLAKKRRWTELGELYESVLERTRDAQVAWDLAKKLGMLRRDELDDLEGAKSAFLRALEHEPGDTELRYWTAELFEAEGDIEHAADQFRAAARTRSDDPDVFRRALWLFEKTGEADCAWSAASVLDLLGEADINESLVADAHRPEGLIAAQGTIADPDWELFYPERERALPAVLEAVSSAAIELALARLDKDGRLPELDPALCQDPGGTTTLARSLVWTLRLLGIDAPALYLAADPPQELVVAPASEPTTLVSRALGSGLGLPELAFIWGRHLALFRPEHYLLAFYPSLRDIAALLVAALPLGGHEADEPLEGRTAEMSAELEAKLDATARARLEEAVSGFDTRNLRRRIAAWMRSVLLSGGRAGLLACGDLHLAATLLERFPPPGGLDAAEELADLRAYSISRQYAELRERLGVGVPG